MVIGLLILTGIMVIAYPVAILYAYNHGLRCGIQAGKGQEPEPVKGPVQLIQERKTDAGIKKLVEEESQKIKEWLYGADEEETKE